MLAVRTAGRRSNLCRWPNRSCCQRLVSNKEAREIIGDTRLNGLKTSDESALLAIRLADLAAALTPTKDVGGKIDAIEIEKGAIHWIARKPNCPEDRN